MVWSSAGLAPASVAINTSANMHQIYPMWGADGYIYFGQSLVGDPFSQRIYRIPTSGVDNATLLVPYFAQYPSLGFQSRIAFLHQYAAETLRTRKGDGSDEREVPGAPTGICPIIAYDQQQDRIYYQKGETLYRINGTGGTPTPLVNGLAPACFASVDYGTIQ